MRAIYRPRLPNIAKWAAAAGLCFVAIGVLSLMMATPVSAAAKPFTIKTPDDTPAIIAAALIGVGGTLVGTILGIVGARSIEISKIGDKSRRELGEATGRYLNALAAEVDAIPNPTERRVAQRATDQAAAEVLQRALILGQPDVSELIDSLVGLRHEIRKCRSLSEMDALVDERLPLYDELLRALARSHPSEEYATYVLPPDAA